MSVLRVVEVSSQTPEDVLAIGRDPIRLTWRIESDGRTGDGPGPAQLGYEIQAASSERFEELIGHVGDATADQVAIPAPGPPLVSREVRFHRVRVESAEGWSDWSPVHRVEAGLLEASEWVARAITLPDDPGSQRPSPAPLLRTEFDVPADVSRARLHVSALGIDRLSVNGRPVSQDLLAPGWTSYRHRLLSDTYDVTESLTPGTNVISAELGDGWYRGRLGWEADGRRRFGDQVALIAQLEIDLADGTTVHVATDESWRASTGQILSADLYDGALVDLRQDKAGWDRAGYDDSSWAAATVVPLDTALIEPRSAPPVRVVAMLRPTVEPRGTGCLALDGGQNIAGWVRIRVKGKAGDTVIVRHAEVLEPDGALHVRSLRSAKATDTYLLADDAETVLEPPFTFHGFRYAEIETDAEVRETEFVAISSAGARRGRFECSDASLTRFHDNVVWSQLDNFVSVPTDCPQRDERLGWTGDAQAFAPTASTLFDSQAFWTSWLRDLDLDQDAELGVSTVVPDVALRDEPRYGRAGWSDAATIVPWAVYESYGDPTVLAAQFGSMRRHVDSLQRRAGDDGLLGVSMQFGDWLDPDAPSDRPWAAKADSTYLANAFFVQSARLLAGAAGVLGDATAETSYRALAQRVAVATWDKWRDHAVTTQTGCAIALRFGIVPDDQRDAVAAALASMVRSAEGRVSTGFLGTPLVLPALSEAGHFDEAYLMLLRHAPPSWLYQVDRGATTVWERWDAILPDGSIHDGRMSPPPDMDGAEEGHMLSFNHYAYGAVVDWVYRHVAGIAPDPSQPGYRRIVFAPRPAVGIDWARASVESPYGTSSIHWQVDGERTLTATIEVPFGSSGVFEAPVSDASITTIDGSSAEDLTLGPGTHTVTVTDARIAGGLG